jgi:flagellar biosynthesis protein
MIVQFDSALGTMFAPYPSEESVNLRLRLAVALKYEHENDSAPRIVASGHGHQADSILSLAERHQVPIHQDGLLAEQLAPMPVGYFIPPELYAAVAEVLAMLVRMDGALRNTPGRITLARP